MHLPCIKEQDFGLRISVKGLCWLFIERILKASSSGGPELDEVTGTTGPELDEVTGTTGPELDNVSELGIRSPGTYTKSWCLVQADISGVHLPWFPNNANGLSVSTETFKFGGL